MKLIRAIWIIAIIEFLSSCSTAKKCREKFPCVESSTTIIRDTVIIAGGRQMDTVFHWTRFQDSIIIQDHETRIETKLIRLPGDSIFVSTDCPSDTIRVEKIIQTTNVIDNDKRDWRVYFWAIFLLLLILVVGFFLKILKQ
jgi:hypothetical protein